MSRTVLTSVTTLIAVVIIYAAGGSGIRPFAFCLLIGIIVGTYSSVAIAAPLVFKKQPSRVKADLKDLKDLNEQAQDMSSDEI